jgi:hypothetical protein
MSYWTLTILLKRTRWKPAGATVSNFDPTVASTVVRKEDPVLLPVYTLRRDGAYDVDVYELEWFCRTLWNLARDVLLRLSLLTDVAIERGSVGKLNPMGRVSKLDKVIHVNVAKHVMEVQEGHTTAQELLVLSTTRMRASHSNLVLGVLCGASFEKVWDAIHVRTVRDLSVIGVTEQLLLPPMIVHNLVA